MENLRRIDTATKGKDVADFIGVSGKVCLITGASAGLGKETAIRLAKEGCHVVIAARRKDRLVEVCRVIEQLEGVGNRQVGKAQAVVLDVTAGEDEIGKSVDEAWQVFGRIDVLFNNAGVPGPVQSCLELSEREWERSMNTNARGTWLVARAVARRMVAAGLPGSIINTSSIMGLERGLRPNLMVYTTSKAAVIQLTKAMAIELGPKRIRVNAIAPGLFDSEATEALFKKSWFTSAAAERTPLQRWGVSDPDFTSVIVFLASDAASYVTGATIVIDGGLSLTTPSIRSSL